MVVSGMIPPDPVQQVPAGRPPGPGEAEDSAPIALVRLLHEGSWMFTLPTQDSSVPQARHAVRELLVRQGVPVRAETADGLLLIVSELVTNAVRYAAVLSPRITVEIEVGAGWITVGVGDDHPYRPTALEADHARTGGRGLMLVHAITTEAGGACDVEHTPVGGKVVRATLPLDL